MNIIKNNWKRIKKEAGALIIAFVLAVAVTLIFGTVAAAEYSKKIQTGIADSVVRFHVIANSDSREDQLLKLKVRAKILEEITPLVENSGSRAETEKFLTENSKLIKTIANDEIKANNFTYAAKISLENCRFPLKKYGDMTFPAGEYYALRVEIGEAAGENFWCVMYPPLCFVEESCCEVEEKTETDLKNILTDEEYSIVMNRKTEEKLPEIKFKIVEWWQEKN